jgi:hypothetical protein
VTNVSANASQIVNRVGDTATTLTGKVLDTTKIISKEGLEALQTATTSSLQFTGNSLKALFGTFNNVAERQNFLALQINMVDKQTHPLIMLESLRRARVALFTKSIREFNNLFKNMVKDEENILKGVLDIFKLRECKTGIVYGYNCDKAITAQIDKFKKELIILKRYNSINDKTLNELIKKGNVASMIGKNKTQEQYLDEIDLNLNNLLDKASKIFNDTLDKFTKLSNSLENQEPSESSPSGGRKRKTVKRKKRYTRRKQSRNKR